MNQQDYFILWSVYAGTAFILLLASIFFTSFLWRLIKEPIVIVVAILLFSPTLIDPERGQYAPAIAVMAMDFLMQIGDHQVTLANELFYRVEIALIIYFVFAIFIRWPIEYGYRKWRQKRQAAKGSVSAEDYVVEEQINDSQHDQESSLQANEKL